MNKVLACLDHSTFSPSICEYASWASKQLGTDLDFCHVLDRHPETAQKLDASGNIGLGTKEDLLEELVELDEKRGAIAMEMGRLLLEAAARRAVDLGIVKPSIRQRHGELVETLDELQGETRLFVLGKRGEAGDKSPQHLGSNLERVIRALHRPILVVPSAFVEPRKIMLAFDGSMTTRKGVEMIAASRLFKGLQFQIITVGPDSPATHTNLDWACEKLNVSGINAEKFVIEGDADNALLEHANRHHVDLLVMGAYGHSRIRHLLIGSTTTSVIRTSSIPILLLR